MVKLADVKVGDIVLYNGICTRIMEKMDITMETAHPIIKIVGPRINTRLHPNDVQLIKSVDLPQLRVGDTVHVADIPDYEKERGDGIWLPEMARCIGKEYVVTELWDHPQCGCLVRLDGWWFRTYHLIEICEYDMI